MAASAQLQASKTMEQELRCPACKGIFVDAVMLQCSHNLCRECARKAIEDEVQVDSNDADAFTQGLVRSETCSGGSGSTSPASDNDKSSLSCSDSDSGYSAASTTAEPAPSSSPPAPSSVAKLVDSFETTGTLTRRAAPRSVTMPILPKSVRCLSCPVCAQVVFLDDRGADSLPLNAMLNSIVDRYRSGDEKKDAADGAKLRPPVPIKSSVKCEMCERSPPPVATVRCSQCDVNYCSTCLDTFHPARGPLAQHQLKPLTQAALKRSSSSRGLRGQKPEVPKRSTTSSSSQNRVGSLPRPSRTASAAKAAATSALISAGAMKSTSCQRHPTEGTSLYCRTCQLSICVQCHDDGKHQSHDVKPIGLTFKLQKSQLSQQMSSLSGKARKAKELVENLRAAKEKLTQNSDHLEEKTAAQFARIMEHLERKKAETLEVIARERELKNKVIQDQLQQSTVKLKQTTGLLEYCIEVMKENDPNSFLQVSGSLIERVACAEQQWRPKYLTKRESSDFNLQLDTDQLIYEIERLNLTKPRAPPTPVIGHCVVKNNTATISWKPTSSNTAQQGVSIEGYKLEMDDGCGGHFQEVYCGVDDTCAISGLSFDSCYRVRVRAFNYYGHSSYSAETQVLTSEVAVFQLREESKQCGGSDLVHENSAMTVGNFGKESKLCFGNVGFVKGSHYWQFVVDAYRPGATLGFGLARSDVNRSWALGGDASGWALHCSAEHSWHVHADQISDKMDKGVGPGSVVGLFLHFGTKTLTFFLDGTQHGDPIALHSPSNGTSRSHKPVPFYPVVYVNPGSKVTLQTGMRCPRNQISLPEQKIYQRAKIVGGGHHHHHHHQQQAGGTAPPPPSQSSSGGMSSLLRNMAASSSIRRGNSAGDMHSISSGDSGTTVTSDPTPELSSFRSFFKRR